MFAKEIKYIHFVNDTDLPLMIDSWVDGSTTLQCLRVGPREKLILHSSVGEWHMNAMLDDIQDRKLWDENPKLKHVIIIGKFRSQSCFSGNYSWLEYDGLYDCIYSELDEPVDGVKGVMTFSLSPLLNIDEVD
jgi:hypothetical protein